MVVVAPGLWEHCRVIQAVLPRSGIGAWNDGSIGAVGLAEKESL